MKTPPLDILAYVILRLYSRIFAYPIFKRFNLLLFHCGLRGLGLLNFANSNSSGEQHFLRRFLKNFQQPVVVDIGAHHGNFASEVFFARSTARIFALEPHPTSVKKLLDKFHMNSQIRIYQIAAGEKSGEALLFDYQSSDGSEHASLVPGIIEEVHGSAAIAHKVAVTTLDEFCISNDICYIDLLKIDAEGNELTILSGATTMLLGGKIGAILFEFNEMNVYSRSFFRDFWKLFDQYDLFRLLPTSLLPIQQYHPLHCELFAYQNIVAILRRTEGNHVKITC